jgi:hypothetical protein
VDVISGGPRVDAIIALGGNDNITKDNFGTVNIADNSTDNVRCGGRTRHIYIAPNENDAVDNECETVIIRP